MQIEYIKGDLFSTNIKTIVHGCNAQGVMGSGVAAIVRKRFEQAYDAYYVRNKTAGLYLGDMVTVVCTDSKTLKEKTIINAITQEYFGGTRRQVSYDAIADVMNKIDNMNIGEIAMPKIGAGLANGDWDVIEKIIESELKHVKPTVYFID